MNLEDIIELSNWKLSVARTQFESENINNVSKLNFNLINKEKFAKESGTLRGEDGKLVHRRGFQGIKNRLKNLDRDFFFINNKVYIPEILPEFYINLIKNSKLPEYTLEVDCIEGNNLRNLSLMFKSKNPIFNNINSTLISPSGLRTKINLIDTTNKHWNMSNNKYDWLNIMYLYNFEDQLKHMVENNFSKDTKNRYKNI